MSVDSTEGSVLSVLYGLHHCLIRLSGRSLIAMERSRCYVWRYIQISPVHTACDLCSSKKVETRDNVLTICCWQPPLPFIPPTLHSQWSTPMSWCVLSNVPKWPPMLDGYKPPFRQRGVPCPLEGFVDRQPLWVYNSPPELD